eukprot:COSAG05_NODE_292_length_12012_cov_12.968354_14_plen_76_part_00
MEGGGGASAHANSVAQNSSAWNFCDRSSGSDHIPSASVNISSTSLARTQGVRRLGRLWRTRAINRGEKAGQRTLR